MRLPKPYQTAITKIQRFRSCLTEYRDLENKNHLTPQEQFRLNELRSELNSRLDETADLVRDSGVSTNIFYEPPPIVGGRAGDLDLFANLFNLQSLQLLRSMVFDLIDRSLGNYHVLRRRFLLRLINPVYWIGEIIRVPFRLLSYAGFNANKAESSLVGRLYKFIVSLATFVWTLIQILNYFGVNVRDFISKVAGG